MKLNNKGFTLIEIMVTLVISSIVMVVAGTIILNSFGYFDKTEKADVDKLAVDKIAELVRDELAYASNVVVADERPDEHDWNAFSITADGYLLQTIYEGTKSTDNLLYNEGFYNHRTLELKARCYNNDYRMDLSFAFLDNTLEQQYETKYTLELINMKSTTTLTESDSSDQHSELLAITGNRKIYYQKGGNNFINDYPILDSKGTVADEIDCKNVLNDKGEWKSGTIYVQGDFVYIIDKSDWKSKIWYRLTAVGISTSNSPDTTWEWKKINMYHDSKTRYMKGDIIVFNQLYYQAIYDTEFDPTVITVWSSGYKTMGDLKSSKGYITPKYNSCKIQTNVCTGTVADKIYDKTTSNDKGVYEVSIIIPDEVVQPASTMRNKFKIGDFVKFDQYWNTEGKWVKGEEKWFISLSDNAGDFIPGSSKSGQPSLYWQYIGPVNTVGKGYKTEYDKYSLYYTKFYYSKISGRFTGTGDIVFNSKDDKYYGAGGTSTRDTTSTGSDPSGADWAQYWTIVTDEELQKNKATCELKLKDSKE